MEAAKPIEIQTPQSEEDISKKLNLNIESNSKKKYSMNILCYSSYLQIDIELINDIKYYSEKFSLNKIKDISKYFLICESISDVICSVEQNINQSQITEENNNLKLIIPLNHPLCKEAIFNIPEKIKIYNNKELYEIICDLKKNFQEMKNKINNQQDIINKQQDKINKQQNIINNQQNDINELKDRILKLEKDKKDKNNIDNDLKNSLIPNDLKDSLIIPNDYLKTNEIKNWIDPSKKIKFQLLFRKSRDGSSCSTFHKLCDFKGPTLTLVRTTENYKFGGYTQFNWKSNKGRSPKDNNDDTFIFSLDLMKKFTKIKNTSTVYFSPNAGPCFGEGGSDLIIGPNSNLHEGKTINCTFLKNYELTNGCKGFFDIKELEIYKVIFC